MSKESVFIVDVRSVTSKPVGLIGLLGMWKELVAGHFSGLRGTASHTELSKTITQDLPVTEYRDRRTEIKCQVRKIPAKENQMVAASQASLSVP